MKPANIPDSTAWAAVQHRDRRFDGQFVYAVSSTRIFCRPSCSSRRPTKANVEFFGSTADAEAAGYRACKRCRPTSAKPPIIDRAVKHVLEYLMTHMDTPVTLATLARETGMSPFHLQRSFKKALGVSPRQY
ncbi:MAG TPA: Ada metal-binding domain-containing protein, partial [Gemmatimonadaceae bacterium]